MYDKVDKILFSDPEVILAAVKNIGTLIQYASDIIRYQNVQILGQLMYFKPLCKGIFHHMNLEKVK